MLVSRLYVALLCTASTGAKPAANNAQSQEKPVLELPYGSFEATERVGEIWTFKNIPYAAPPVGELRWQKPAPPLKVQGMQQGNRKGPACLQAGVYGVNVLGHGNDNDIGKIINSVVGSTDILPMLGDESEDCLFLDVQVPEKALRNPSLKLPVVVYMHGGAYVAGDKDILRPILPLYDGSGMMKQSGHGIIFVVFNYRVGAPGFLAGTTMEADGLPNAGLWDQRAAFQWVQDNISKVGGDPGQVTAMGESAGAGSILFHLVAKGGKLDPLFRRAILMSPAYEPMWDRKGIQEDRFQLFAELAGCRGRGLSCLRGADTKAIAKANRRLMELQPPGTFAVGPTPDGLFIRQLPTVELANGNVWPIESLLLSHTSRESTVFVSGAIDTNGKFDKFLRDVFPNYTFANGLDSRILEHYPPIGSSRGSVFKTQSDRMEALVRDACLTCNVRYLAEALGRDKVWIMQYSVTPGWHGTDIIPAFYNDSVDLSSLVDAVASLLRLAAGLILRGLSRAYQSYLTSYIRTGDPNARRLTGWQNLPYPGTVTWERPRLSNKDAGDDKVSGVLNVDYGLFRSFGTVEDDQMPGGACNFWRDFSAAVTVAGGYVPEGETVEQSLVDDGSRHSSVNFVGGNSE